ncbi:hypothetical protein pdam_00024669 [Pocillopora damicornis]|uniref:Uncharacterized protein n=1 Tax=Pocillopora damicornis TaxID=46731 RepID=A0A3M6TH41_POCDA|nr:hypothetical protein pdam_00024669 [Pocillopora damicornis]
MDTNRDSAHQSQNEDDFPTFSLGLEFLNEAEKEKNNGKGDSASAPSRFASLSEREMQQFLTERHSGKTKQMTNWSVSTFKGLHNPVHTRPNKSSSDDELLQVWDKEKILNPYVIGIVTDSLLPSYDNPFIPWSDSPDSSKRKLMSV